MTDEQAEPTPEFNEQGTSNDAPTSSTDVPGNSPNEVPASTYDVPTPSNLAEVPTSSTDVPIVSNLALTPNAQPDVITGVEESFAIIELAAFKSPEPSPSNIGAQSLKTWLPPTKCSLPIVLDESAFAIAEHARAEYEQALKSRLVRVRTMFSQDYNLIC